MPMKTSQIAVGTSYEDKLMNTIRTVTGIFATEGGGRVVEYTEHPPARLPRPLYWPLRRLPRMPLAEFALWAARPAGTKKHLSEKKFMDWARGPTDRLARSR